MNEHTEKINYICRLREDYTLQFLHPIKTLIEGLFLGFYPILLEYVFYLLFFTNTFNFIYKNFSDNSMAIFCVAMLIVVVVVNIFLIIPKLVEVGILLHSNFQKSKKMPLMKINYRKAKVLIKNVETFKPGSISISRKSAYDMSYYGVDCFLGFCNYDTATKTNIAFVGNFVCNVLLICSQLVYDFRQTMSDYGERHGKKILLNKQKRQKFTKEQSHNEQISIEALLETINNMKKDSNSKINSGISGINEVINHD